MKQRCYDQNFSCYADYGGRGIKVCERWRDNFEAFLEDMGRKPSRSYTLERIDNDRGYEPGNVKWATRAEQANNRRNVILITHDGQSHSIAEWERIKGVRPGSIKQRIWSGWSPGRAITEPFRKHVTRSHH
jgi:hypothetical protein